MKFADTDPAPLPVPPGSDPDYNTQNPLRRIIRVYEAIQFAAEREHYQQEHVQVLLPLESVRLYGPREPNQNVLDYAGQDFVDFQKQNVCDFVLGDFMLVRGWVTVGPWTGAFLRISYRGGPDSRLSKVSGHQLGAAIKLFLKVGEVTASELITVPYNLRSDRYEVEIWADPGQDLSAWLDIQGLEAFARKELLIIPSLVWGTPEDFRRPMVDDQPMQDISKGHLMHPINPLRMELAVSDDSETFWDSNGGQNYVYEFCMTIRGWDNYLKVGASSNPHGGIGHLEYRNLLSNYFEFQSSGELGRTPRPWSKDAFGEKSHGGRPEPFLALDYMDLHIVRPNAGIGLHRHRDNQEIFMALENEVVMLQGDWVELPARQRAIELRTLRAGHFALLKAGQMHGLINPTDEDVPFLMFGGYD